MILLSCKHCGLQPSDGHYKGLEILRQARSQCIYPLSTWHHYTWPFVFAYCKHRRWERPENRATSENNGWQNM